MFLTDEQLEQLTKKRRPSAQRRWLIGRGYKFDVRDDGSPVVLEIEVRRHLYGRSASSELRQEPNLDALDETV